MNNKKPFLYKNRRMILPEKIEVGKRIRNRYNFIEEIYKTTFFDNGLTYFATLERIVDGEEDKPLEIHRFYQIKEGDLNSLKELARRFEFFK